MNRKNVLILISVAVVVLMIGVIFVVSRGNKEKNLLKDIVKVENVKNISLQYKLEKSEIGESDKVDKVVNMLSKCECTLEADEELPKGWIYRIRFDESKELTIISGELVSYNNKLYSVEGMDIELIDEVTGITRQ